MRNRTNKNKVLVFDNVNEALAELNAQSKGRYFLCTCPECQRDEAFIYKNNLNFIQCNRENHCGERMILQYRERENENMQNQEIVELYPKLSKDQVDALDWTDRAFEHVQNYFESETLNRGYRGISKDITKDFVVDFQNEEMVSLMFRKIEPLIGKDYSKSTWMKKRNLVFPIRGDEGTVERILLRSSIDPDIEPKEIQLVMNPSKDTRDFFVDIPKNAETIVISESLLDGLSFREIDPEIGVLALTGASKTRKLICYLKENKEFFKNKNVILSLDDDEAGYKATSKFIDAFQEGNIVKSYDVFVFSGSKDANEFLQRDKNGFIENYRQSLEFFKKVNRQNRKVNQYELER